jgi:hypothetical protein
MAMPKRPIVRVAVALSLLACACACSGDDSAGDGSAGRAGDDTGEDRGNAARGLNASGAGGRGSGTIGIDAGPRDDAGGTADSGAGADTDAATAGTGGVAAGAGGEPDSGGAGSSGSSGSAPDSECDPNAMEHVHDSTAPAHVAVPLAASSYNSSPPSSGPHCNEWGSYAVYGEDAPLPACNFLHNLEHGAVVLLYNCPDGCADQVEALEQLIAAAPADPDCGAQKRLLLTPYAEMDATIAAVAWGFTWTADCLDEAARDSLLDFIADHQGSGGDAPEPTVCANGSIAP